MIAAAFLVAAVAAPAPGPLQAQIAAKIRAFPGEMGLYAKDLDTGEIVAVDADARFPTASLIKVAVMAEVFRQMNQGKFGRDTPVTLHNSDKAGDETVPLNMLHDGTVLTVADLLKFMIAYSDNTATNLLVGMVGTANVDALLDSYGLTKTRLYRPTFRDGRADVLPEEEKEYGLGSTTPREAGDADGADRAGQGRVALRLRRDDRAARDPAGPCHDPALAPLRDGRHPRRQQDRLGRGEKRGCEGFQGRRPQRRRVRQGTEGAFRHRHLRAEDQGQARERRQRHLPARGRAFAHGDDRFQAR